MSNKKKNRRIIVKRKWYSFNASELGKAFIIAAITFLIIYFIADSFWPRRYYTSDIKLFNTTVAEKQQENGKYYIRASNTGIDRPISSDDLWFEVKQDFYTKHDTNTPVGISLVQIDAYKTELIGGGRVLESSTWGVQEIYNSYEEAQQANPYKKYISEATLEKKKETGNGQKFFILKSDDRSYTLKVDDLVYNKYSEKQQIKCTFEAVGEFVKLLDINL
jgi:hypothetical protein